MIMYIFINNRMLKHTENIEDIAARNAKIEQDLEAMGRMDEYHGNLPNNEEEYIPAEINDPNYDWGQPPRGLSPRANQVRLRLVEENKTENEQDSSIYTVRTLPNLAGKVSKYTVTGRD